MKDRLPRRGIEFSSLAIASNGATALRLTHLGPAAAMSGRQAGDPGPGTVDSRPDAEWRLISPARLARGDDLRSLAGDDGGLTQGHDQAGPLVAQDHVGAEDHVLAQNERRCHLPPQIIGPPSRSVSGPRSRGRRGSAAHRSHPTGVH